MRIVLCYQAETRHVEQIRAIADDFEVVHAGPEHIAHEILAADIFFGHAKVPVPWEETVQRGRLQWIQSSAAGLDHCLVPAVVESDVVVTGASGLFADQVAEQTLALLLGLIRSLPTFFRAQLRKDFTRQPTGDLHGKTVGIIGFGGNGQRIAELLAPFRVRILATDQHEQPRPPHVDELLPADHLESVLGQADVVILTVPLTETTRGMIDRSALRQIKPGSLLINVARGQVVIENDLIASLDDRTLGGAGLDVTEVEPLPKSSPLWEQPNVIITPHVGAQSAVRFDVVTDFFCENLQRFRSGHKLLNRVEKSLGYPLPQDRVALPWQGAAKNRS